MNIRVAVDRTAGAEQPEQQEVGEVMRKISADLYSPASCAPICSSEITASTWPAVIGRNMNAGVREDRAMSASDQISAREAGFVTRDLEVHDHLLPWQRD